jgi:hypothetical protein
VSENITHVAVCDDVTRLAARHPDVHADLNRALRAHQDVARFGAGTQSADRWTADLLTWAGAEAAKPQEARDPRLEAKLAFVLGALTHRAADRLMKPIIYYPEATEGHEGFVEATIHCDVFVFKEIYGGGAGPDAGPYPRAILDAPAGEGQRQLEEYFRVLWRRAIVAMHTFSPDRSDMQSWMDKLLDTLQQFPMEMARYARIAAEWDPVKVKRYLEDTHFYDRDDPLIRCARGIQHGEAVPAADVVAAAAATDEASSRYARALSKGLGYVVAAGRLYAGEIDVATAKTRFDVGVPELTLAYTGPEAVSAGGR